MGVIKINGYKRKKAESIWGATPDDRCFFPLARAYPRPIGVPIVCIRVEWIHSNSTFYY